MKVSAPDFAARPHTVQWAFLATLSVFAAAALHLAGLPAAFFLGPMVAAVFAGVNGVSVRVPRLPSTAAQGIMGAFIAGAITPSILHTFLEDWAVILGVVFAIIAASSTLGFCMSRWHVMPGTTSVWGSSPGAANAMIIMAQDFGADARLVAFMQYFRVACVAGLASVIAAASTHASGLHAPAFEWFPAVRWQAFGETLLLVGVCVTASLTLRLPSGPMIVTLIIGSVLNLSGVLTIELPKWLLIATYTLLGWGIGLNFTPAILKHAVRALPKILLSVALLIAFCAGLAYMLTRTLGIDALTAYLATSPGGLDSVAIIGATSHVDVPFVMALQTIRFLVIVMIGPPLARLAANHMPQTDSLREEPR